jgi:hypothetical protein
MVNSGSYPFGIVSLLQIGCHFVPHLSHLPITAVLALSSAESKGVNVVAVARTISAQELREAVLEGLPNLLNAFVGDKRGMLTTTSLMDALVMVVRLVDCACRRHHRHPYHDRSAPPDANTTDEREDADADDDEELQVEVDEATKANMASALNGLLRRVLQGEPSYATDIRRRFSRWPREQRAACAHSVLRFLDDQQHPLVRMILLDEEDDDETSSGELSPGDGQ